MLLRSLLLLISASLAAAATFWLSPPTRVLSPQATTQATVAVAVLTFALYFTALFPLWLPAAIPARMRKTCLVVSSVCACLLFAAVLMLLYVSSAEPGIPTALFITLAALVGAVHVASARREYKYSTHSARNDA